MNSVFIYGLNCPTTGRCRYIGKAINPQKRFIRHLWEADKVKSHKNHWVSSLTSRGLQPVLEVLDCVPSGIADQTERDYIRVFRAIGIDLTNQTDGGSGTYGFAPWCKGLKLPKRPRPSRAGTAWPKRKNKGIMSAEVREKHRIAGLNRAPVSEATREKMSRAKRGVRNWKHLDYLHACNRGKKRPPEVRKNISEGIQKLRQLALDRASKSDLPL